MMGIKRALACLMAVAFVPISMFHGSEVVLCIAEDGHIALEIALNGQCMSGPDAPLTTPNPTASSIEAPRSTSHCGPCLDVPMTAYMTTLPSRCEHKPVSTAASKAHNFLMGYGVFPALLMSLETTAFNRIISCPLSVPPARTIVLRN
ncbi:MAG TPA: hypothetical protein PLI09_07530 [Candidatus Hydrogenedentes bacterium]|nr:hypothetical protein [Candidatus Hydrogenedentota bacterium]